MLSAFTPTQKGILYALSGFTTFVISDSCAKWLAPHYPVVQIVSWLYFCCLCVGLILSPALGGVHATLKTNKLRFHIGRGICNLGLAVSVTIAFQNLPLTSVYPILFLSPFVITALAVPLYHERVSALNWLTIAAGFCGVLIAYRPWEGDVNPWVIVPFFTVFCIAGLGLLARPLGEKETLLSLFFYPSLTNAAILLPYALWRYPLPAIEHWPIFILGGVMLACGISGVAGACRITRYAVIAPLQYTQLILAFIIGYFIFDEYPDSWMIAGSVIIAGSGVMLALERRETR